VHKGESSSWLLEVVVSREQWTRLSAASLCVFIQIFIRHNGSKRTDRHLHNSACISGLWHVNGGPSRCSLYSQRRSWSSPNDNDEAVVISSHRDRSARPKTVVSFLSITSPSPVVLTEEPSLCGAGDGGEVGESCRRHDLTDPARQLTCAIKRQKSRM